MASLASSSTRASIGRRDARVRSLPASISPEHAFGLAASKPFPFFLDTSFGGEAERSFSFVGHSPDLRFTARGRRLSIASNLGVRRLSADPFAAMRWLLEGGRQPAAQDVPAPFRGGFVGFLGYDLGRHVERLPSEARSDLPFPDLHLSRYPTFLAFEHATGHVHLIGEAGPAADEWRRLFESGAAPPSGGGEVDRARAPSPDVGKDRYLACVRRVKRYIAAGDVYQVNLARRFSGSTRLAAPSLFSRLRRTNPAPYGAYLGLAHGAVLSSSPECFLRVSGRWVETRPIKGTRPRGSTLDADRSLRSELQASPKDRAELAMIVDLERNDLGRVCEFGSVEASWPPDVESYATVHHLVSTVSGRLRENADVVDLLRATFPGGSITGAPKIRAMEIIDELEPSRRSVYTGSIGWIGSVGSAAFSIAIRTILFHRGRVWFHAGGGIVADSDPEKEYEETIAKAEGLRRAFSGR